MFVNPFHHGTEGSRLCWTHWYPAHTLPPVHVCLMWGTGLPAFGKKFLICCIVLTWKAPSHLVMLQNFTSDLNSKCWSKLRSQCSPTKEKSKNQGSIRGPCCRCVKIASSPWLCWGPHRGGHSQCRLSFVIGLLYVCLFRPKAQRNRNETWLAPVCFTYHPWSDKSELWWRGR